MNVITNTCTTASSTTLSFRVLFTFRCIYKSFYKKKTQHVTPVLFESEVGEFREHKNLKKFPSLFKQIN